jgi:hypothetical protein
MTADAGCRRFRPQQMALAGSRCAALRLPTGQMALAGSRYDAISGISEMQHALAPVDTVSTDKVQKHKNPLRDAGGFAPNRWRWLAPAALRCACRLGVW